MRKRHTLRARAEAHIAAMERRTASDHERLAEILHGWCWPGEGTDRLEPAAAEWVRRWGRACPYAPVVECTCAHGRCEVCN